MEPISNVDRIALLLRQKLLERTRGAARAATGKSSGAAGGVGLVRALTEQDDIDGRLLRRAFVQSLLTEQFGDDLANSAQFQQTVERVTDAIAADADASTMLTQAIDAVRSK